jgi:decaprenyl-phosphate phosphoribosyltransferase
MGIAGEFLRLARPQQWTKNLLVLAAPLAAAELQHLDVLGATLLALVSFCLASSSVYCLNDVVDAGVDRVHPRKQHRPVAAGAVSPRAALVMAAVLGFLSLAVAAWAGPALLVLLAGYLILQVLYSTWLKHEPVMDISVITAGFVMRAVAGGLAADLRISQWFLLVAGFGSLFIVAGKRYSELHTLGSEAGTRRSLIRYTDTYLRFVWSIAATATIMSYSLWAFEQTTGTGIEWHTISIAPFVLGMLRYAVDVDAGRASEPEEIVLADRALQVTGLVWLVVVCLGIFSG